MENASISQDAALRINADLSNLYLIILFGLLFLSSIVQLLDTFGWLPRCFKRRINEKQASSTIQVLRELGVDIPSLERSVYRSKPWYMKVMKLFIKQGEPSLYDTVKTDLCKYIKKNAVYVGSEHRRTLLENYCDLMGGLCDPVNVQFYAQCLSALFGHLTDSNEISTKYDFVVTPKCGSPILGYEFAKLLQKPFLLHEKTPRFEMKKNGKNFEASFCCVQKPKSGAIGLIVDDSVTKGSNAIAIIEDLKKFGYNVENCLVVYHIESGSAMQRLEGFGVKLFSIVSLDKSVIKEIPEFDPAR